MIYHFLLHLVTLVSFFQESLACELITIKDYENYANQRLPLGLLEYLQRGADGDKTLQRNVDAFSEIAAIPKCLVDVSSRTTKAEALGKHFKLPVGISPSGLQKRWHPDGELGTVRAAGASGTIMIVSSASSVSFEDIAKEEPNTEKWMQLELYDNRSVTYDFVKQAEDLQYGAIVVTVDDVVSPLRYFNKKNSYKDHHEKVNYAKYDLQSLKTDQATWRQFRELVNSTRLPVIIKGILTSEDAKLAYEHGAKGIIVSNHGGRQIDGTISTIEALSEIVSNFPASSRSGFEIYLDSGIRSGLDVFRALAIGAKFVFIGRLAMWGLFHSGQQGVENILNIIQRELHTLLGQTGCNTINDITTRHVSYNFRV